MTSDRRRSSENGRSKPPQPKKTNARARDAEVAYVLGQHFTCDLHMKRDLQCALPTHTRTKEYARTNNNETLVCITFDGVL